MADHRPFYKESGRFAVGENVRCLTEAQEVIMAEDQGIRLEFSDERKPVTSLVEVNDAMADIGSRVWPLDFGRAPEDVQELLLQPTLTKAEAERVKAHFLLPRQRLLEVITGSGRAPWVADGGELTTWVSPHGYSYPQLYIVQDEVDYSRFDRFHVNVADDGTGVDEVAQLLSGSGLVIHQRLPSGLVLTLRLDCPGEGAGWLVTYNGDAPHIGSISSAAPGTKLLVQVIGPAQWVMRYEDDG